MSTQFKQGTALATATLFYFNEGSSRHRLAPSECQIKPTSEVPILMLIPGKKPAPGNIVNTSGGSHV
ncbi:hypothetical protein [Craterilacuibacter sp.]|uniref:hypothetical protein n=1 Tax=Craterilacuibacter sp. TaxID=2870909 RepID=UPI003F2DA98E